MRTVRMYPLVIMLIALASSYGLNRYFPIREIVPEMIRYLGIVPVLASIWIVGKSALRFRKHDTTVMPYERSSALVIDGYYEYSRNPMYLAMLLFLAGAAWLLGSVTAFLPVPFMYAILRFRVIAMEEGMLEEMFGEEYLAYKRKVRRWL